MPRRAHAIRTDQRRNIILTASSLEARHNSLLRDSDRAATAVSAQKRSATYRLRPAPETTPTNAHNGEATTLIPAGRRRNAAQIAPSEVFISEDGIEICHASRPL